MSEWRKLNIEEKVAQAPVKRSDATAAELEYREELREYAQLMTIKNDPRAWDILCRRERYHLGEVK